MNSPDVSFQSEDGCLIRGNPTRFKGHALVAYVDILGMSDAIIKSWGAQSDSALDRLLRIKNAIPRDDAKTQVSLSIYDPMTNKDSETYLSITRTLSDSIVTMHALPSLPAQCNVQQFNTRVFSVLFCLRLIWQQSLREGFTIRGAIELGEMFWDETEFIGPCLVYAHRLEDKFACTSRILVGPELATNIVKFSQINPNMESPMDAFCTSKDKKIIIDPHFLIGQEMTDNVERLQQDAGSSKKSKYDELIEILRTSKETVSRPNLDAMCSYKNDILEQLHST